MKFNSNGGVLRIRLELIPSFYVITKERNTWGPVLKFEKEKHDLSFNGPLTQQILVLLSEFAHYTCYIKPLCVEVEGPDKSI